MKKLLVFILIPLLLTGCGDTSDTPDDQLAGGDFAADSYLPGTLSGIALQTMTVLKTRSKVTEYVGSLAENYFDYGLVGMAAAVYEARGSKLSVEIAQFTDAAGAYGFYARLRPDNAKLEKLGVEAYAEGNSLYFTQAEYAVTLSVAGDDSSATDLLNRLAVTISVDMGPAGSIPPEFALFPKEKQIRASFRFFPRAYLGMERVDHVYTCRYAFPTDTLTLFLTRDEQGVAYLAARESAGAAGGNDSLAGALGFDDAYAVQIERAGYGTVVAGLAGGYFAGAYSFNEKRHGQLVKDWLAALKD